MIHDAASGAQVPLGPTSTSDAILAVGGSTGWRGRPTEEMTLEARVDGSAERFSPGTWIGAQQPPGARRTNAGVGVDATLRAAPPLTLAASARGDAWFDTSDESGTDSTDELRPTGNLGAELDLGPVTLATHGGLLARPPSFVERFGNRGAFIGDPLLRPESATTIDAGATLHEAARAPPPPCRGGRVRDVRGRPHRLREPGLLRKGEGDQHRARTPPRNRGRGSSVGVRSRAPPLAHRARDGERERVPLRRRRLRATSSARSARARLRR